MTNSLFNFKVLLALAVIALLVFSIFLWMQTPQLFEYFNQAFLRTLIVLRHSISLSMYSILKE